VFIAAEQQNSIYIDGMSSEVLSTLWFIVKWVPTMDYIIPM